MWRGRRCYCDVSLGTLYSIMSQLYLTASRQANYARLDVFDRNDYIVVCHNVGLEEE